MQDMGKRSSSIDTIGHELHEYHEAFVFIRVIRAIRGLFAI
jgi:hypothetical protein